MGFLGCGCAQLSGWWRQRRCAVPLVMVGAASSNTVGTRWLESGRDRCLQSGRDRWLPNRWKAVQSGRKRWRNAVAAVVLKAVGTASSNAVGTARSEPLLRVLPEPLE